MSVKSTERDSERATSNSNDVYFLYNLLLNKHICGNLIYFEQFTKNNRSIKNTYEQKK